MIPVTKSFLPPIEDYMAQVQRVFHTGWLTNRGELVKELEAKLMAYLQTDNILITTNGTIPLQIALKLLGKGGEIITTPFSYVATTAAIVWENCTPVFVDIHPEYLTIDETKIEAAITPRTTCILATHVFGNPCNIPAIESIAHQHNLKVIYDAAHCFGVTYAGKSIFSYGDVSTCSFHATKLFHTGEGGAVFCPDPTLRHQVYCSHNFGHKGKLDFHGLGINGKISELQAAMGLAIVPFIDSILEDRKRLVAYYDACLNFEHLRKIKIRAGTHWNYSYYPILFPSEETLLLAEQRLIAQEIFPRRYFYPSLNMLSFSTGNRMPVSERVASRILCLPLYYGLSPADQDKVCHHINTIFRS